MNADVWRAFLGWIIVWLFVCLVIIWPVWLILTGGADESDDEE